MFGGVAQLVRALELELVFVEKGMGSNPARVKILLTTTL